MTFTTAVENVPGGRRTDRVALVFVTLLVSCGCAAGDATDPDAATGCPTHDNPTFELGTGATEFVPFTDGADVQLARGPQGGCHVWLSVRTDGFAERLFEVRYLFTDADTGREIIESRETRRLSPVGGGRCELVGVLGFVIEAWRMENRRMRMQVTVTDNLGRSASTDTSIVVRWPDPVTGFSTPLLCGPRTGGDAGLLDGG